MSLQRLPSFSRKQSLAEIEDPDANHCLAINPSRELSFSLSKNKFCADLSIRNRTNETVLFRVRTTAAKHYIVVPTCGIIPPRDKRNIQIFMPSREHIVDRADDKFLVQAFVYNGDDLKTDDSKAVNRIFELYSKSMSSKHFQNSKLQVHFEINTPLRHEAADDWVLSNKAKTTKGYSVAQETIKSIVNTEEDNQAAANSSTRRTSALSKNQWPAFKSPDYGPDHSLDLRDLVTQKYDEIKLIKAQREGPVLYGSRTQTIDTNLEKAETRSSLHSKATADKDRNTVYEDVSEAKSEDMSCQMMSKYQGRFKDLEHKYKHQKALLATLTEQTEKYRAELNKLRIISSYQNNDDRSPRPRSNKLRVEVWQMLLVSITFLILGSMLK